MKMNYSPKDWQLLSNYLDGQLTNQEVSVLKTRLAKEPQLHQAYKEMQQTRYLLQHAKKLPVPRSFTLTPEMTNQVRFFRKPLFPIFSFASVIATIFLVVIILFEFLPGMLKDGMLQQSGAPNEMLAMEAMEEDATGSPMIIQWGSPNRNAVGGEGGFGGGGGADAGMLVAPPIGGGVEIEPGVPEMPAEEPAPAPEEEQAFTKSAEPEPITGAGPILGIRSADETDAFNDSVLNILGESADEPIPTIYKPFPWLRFSQILLASIAVISAIIAITLRKRSF